MDVCIHISGALCIGVCIYTCMCVCVCTCLCVCMCVCLCMYVFTCLCVCMCVCLCMYMFTCIYACVCCVDTSSLLFYFQNIISTSKRTVLRSCLEHSKFTRKEMETLYKWFEVGMLLCIAQHVLWDRCVHYATITSC